MTIVCPFNNPNCDGSLFICKACKKIDQMTLVDQEKEKQFLADMYGICVELLKNSGHSFGIDFGRLNESLIEINKRGAELGMTRTEMDKRANIQK